MNCFSLRLFAKGFEGQRVGHVSSQTLVVPGRALCKADMCVCVCVRACVRVRVYVCVCESVYTHTHTHTRLNETAWGKGGERRSPSSFFFLKVERLGVRMNN